jgi:subtilisin family serine protease
LRLIGPKSRLQIATAGQTIGHAATASSICVAASDASAAVASSPFTFTTASPTEDSSSDGPHKMFYRPDGTPITPGNFLASGGVSIQSPAITAGDGGATSVPGFEQFYGTSAAAPAAAGIAALVWSKYPSLKNTQLRAILERSCLDIEAPGFDINSGNGLLMADLALAQAVTVNTTPTNLVAVVNGTNLNLSWPSDRIGWRLLAQVSHLANGVSTNLNDWATIAGSDATNAVTVPIDPAKPTGFLRLVYP